MFIGHKQKSKDEIKASIRIGVKAREKREKEKQNQVDARWLLDIREWKYPETNKKNNNNRGI
tara:strand:- start:33 stop:218 length:186 start_codon:yes stop_codon:yes gene_type:complete